MEEEKIRCISSSPRWNFSQHCCIGLYPNRKDDVNINGDDDQEDAESYYFHMRHRIARGLIKRGYDRDSERFKDLLNKRVAEVIEERRKVAHTRTLERRLKSGWKHVWLGTHRGEQENRALVDEEQTPDLSPLTVCGRPADLGTLKDFNLLRDYSVCPGGVSQDVLLLEGSQTFGRTGNNLIEFLHALQFSRDKNVVLGIMSDSWAFQVILKMWMAIEDTENWESQFEEAFCCRIFHSQEELEGWNVIHKDTKELFGYVSGAPLEEYVASQEDSIRTLFEHYNTWDGVDKRDNPVQDMCSGIDAIFGEQRSSVYYSVIHSRHLEGAPGVRLMKRMARLSGCDPTAALEMRPDYIKSILEPLGMMQHPIVLVTDGQDFSVIQRLLTDSQIGPRLHVVPEEASWVGGDLTLAILSDVFIGNPASSFSGFIAKSRLALGFGHNNLFRAKNANDRWVTVCGDNCVFDSEIMMTMA
eukprot:g13370.t1 g13370   contig8:527562-536153(+)